MRDKAAIMSLMFVTGWCDKVSWNIAVNITVHDGLSYIDAFHFLTSVRTKALNTVLFEIESLIGISFFKNPNKVYVALH